MRSANGDFSRPACHSQLHYATILRVANFVESLSYIGLQLLNLHTWCGSMLHNSTVGLQAGMASLPVTVVRDLQLSKVVCWLAASS